jgi:hypothetical protein
VEHDDRGGELAAQQLARRGIFGNCTLRHVFSVSISEGVWLTEIPGIIAVVICLIASARAGKQLETLVNDRMEHMSSKPTWLCDSQ